MDRDKIFMRMLILSVLSNFLILDKAIIIAQMAKTLEIIKNHQNKEIAICAGLNGSIQSNVPAQSVWLSELLSVGKIVKKIIVAGIITKIDSKERQSDIIEVMENILRVRLCLQLIGQSLLEGSCCVDGSDADGC